jgi:hypothetical protein
MLDHPWGKAPTGKKLSYEVCSHFCEYQPGANVIKLFTMVIPSFRVKSHIILLIRVNSIKLPC